MMAPPSLSLRRSATFLLWVSPCLLLPQSHAFTVRSSLNHASIPNLSSRETVFVTINNNWNNNSSSSSNNKARVDPPPRRIRNQSKQRQRCHKELSSIPLFASTDPNHDGQSETAASSSSSSSCKANDDNDQESLASSSYTSELEPLLLQQPLSSSSSSSRRLFGFLLPLARILDETTGGWALSYADLSPETPTTPVGVGFLATNVAYLTCGLLLVANGNALLGVLTELASVASFAYHFCQLKLGVNQPLVRVALLLDYVVAAATLLAALVYVIQVGVTNVPLEGLIACVLAVVFLFLSWVWEEGLPYVINHGLWHLVGAYGGFLIGQAQRHP